MEYEKEEEEEGGLHRRSIQSVETEYSTWLVATMATVIIKEIRKSHDLRCYRRFSFQQRIHNRGPYRDFVCKMSINKNAHENRLKSIYY